MNLEKDLRNKFNRIADRYIMEILQDAARRRPADLEALLPLADLLTRSGLIEDGLQVDLKLVDLLPTDPVVHYNLACSYALLNQRDHAFDILEKSIRLGYTDHLHMEKDMDLDNLRHDPRYQACLKAIRD